MRCGRDILGGNALHGLDRFHDGAQFSRESGDLVITQRNAGKPRQMAHGIGGHF